MSQHESDVGALYSPLASDPDLGEIVQMFVDEMPERVGKINGLVAACDWEGLRSAAHQLKGAAGSHGFAPVTPSAASVEDAIRDGQPETQIRKAVEELCDLCRRIRAGTGE
ncbi:MAG: Hpt domain-containing protein [Planctomycetia bacterium]|nr:Hpt domain-containing protein [Planctomycetia bacterium]